MPSVPKLRMRGQATAAVVRAALASETVAAHAANTLAVPFGRTAVRALNAAVGHPLHPAAAPSALAPVLKPVAVRCHESPLSPDDARTAKVKPNLKQGQCGTGRRTIPRGRRRRNNRLALRPELPDGGGADRGKATRAGRIRMALGYDPETT